MNLLVRYSNNYFISYRFGLFSKGFNCLLFNVLLCSVNCGTTCIILHLFLFVNTFFQIFYFFYFFLFLASKSVKNKKLVITVYCILNVLFLLLILMFFCTFARFFFIISRFYLQVNTFFKTFYGNLLLFLRLTVC